MNSPRASSSPSYRNIKYKHSQSPIELKEKMRKDYKNKIQNCRNMLMNRFRGSGIENDLQNTLAELYKKTFNFEDTSSIDVEESELLEEIKRDLIQEELQWCLEEYEKSQLENADWSSYQSEDNVICPLCQKFNLKLNSKVLSCEKCKFDIKTHLSLKKIQTNIFEEVESHNKKCIGDIQFTIVPDNNENHIFFLCDVCLEMQLVI